jgi:hypothetical protein
MAQWVDYHLCHTFDLGTARLIYSELKFPENKPPALVSIDDRVIQFTGQWPSIEELKNFKPWNRR